MAEESGPVDEQLQTVKAQLARFLENNGHVTVSRENSEVVLDQPWGGDGVRIVCGLDESAFIADLNNVKLDPRFDAIIHLDRNVIEFVFSYLDPAADPIRDFVNREFTILFQGYECACKFAEPTDRLLAIALRVKRSPSEEAYHTVPQIEQFRDAQHLAKLRPQVQQYFKGKVARSFYIALPTSVDEIDVASLARHMNLLARYYDRRAPRIVVRNSTDHEPLSGPSRVRFLDSQFPAALVARNVDDFMMTLLEVAGESTARMAFLYCYQVFEYAGFYYVDDKVRRELRKMLRDPGLINCDETKVTKLFGLFANLQQTDEARMQKVIEDCCDPETIWKEVMNDKAFFASEQLYDGGFRSKALISHDTSLDSWSASWMPNVFQYITRIRNCLVHARERRESTVILPSESNNAKVARCMPLILRMAEQVALKSEMSDV